MGAQGIFKSDERVELLDGEILVMSPQCPRHVVVLNLLAALLRVAFASSATVRTQQPLALEDRSEPEPDIAVVPGEERDYLSAHPRSALLVVEVSDTTLATDRGKKAEAYARAGIRDYWVVNLVDSVVEVHRNPRRVSRALGWSYESVKRVKIKESVSPLALPRRKVRVADFLA